jgi:hypothetical protein
VNDYGMDIMTSLFSHGSHLRINLVTEHVLTLTLHRIQHELVSHTHQLNPQVEVISWIEAGASVQVLQEMLEGTPTDSGEGHLNGKQHNHFTCLSTKVRVEL